MNVEEIILEGTVGQKLALYGFEKSDGVKMIYKKFLLFSRGNYPRYFAEVSAPFHRDFVLDMIESYYGQNRLICGFRGCGKTSLKKLFDVFVLLNDLDNYRKHFKVLSLEKGNSQRYVTDVYNLIVEVMPIYGTDVFAPEEDKAKPEETKGSFKLRSGKRMAAGTVGQTQRGHLQDAFRPDYITFDDVEDSKSVDSRATTHQTIKLCAEAIDGLSKDGAYIVIGNYISDAGVIQYFMNKESVKSRVVPIEVDGKPTWEKVFDKKKIEKIKKEALDFYGEYLQDPAKAATSFFDLDRIEEDMKLAKQPNTVSAGVKYWANYKPHHRYGMGSDHSDGIGKDSNALAVFDFTTGELIATYYNNKIAPDLSAHEFARVGGEFGNCLWAWEVNNSCGGIVSATVRELQYPNIYYRKRLETGITTKKPGWETNRKTKRNMFFDFKRDYNDGLIQIKDIEILKEMKHYKNADLEDVNTGLVTSHFDGLTATVIAYAMRDEAGHGKTDIATYKKQYEMYVSA